MKGSEEGNLKQAEERCRGCVALVSKDGVWWCDEGDCPVEKVGRCTEWGESEIKIMHLPHPDLIPDTVNGGWKFRPVEIPVPLALDTHCQVLKLNSPSRVCPIHGWVYVKNRSLDTKSFTSVESLSCGHVLLVSRMTKGMKKKKNPLHAHKDPRNWIFSGWNLTFKQGTLIQTVVRPDLLIEIPTPDLTV